MAKLQAFLVTFRGGNYKVIQARNIQAAFRYATTMAGSDLNDVQQIPSDPEDWHEREEELMHTLG